MAQTLDPCGRTASARDMSRSAKEGVANITGPASFTCFNEQKLPGYGVALYEAVGKEHKVTCAGHDVQLLPQNPASDPLVDHMFRYNVMTGPKGEAADVAPFVRHKECCRKGDPDPARPDHVSYPGAWLALPAFVAP
ncbi:hypothetical protein [Komagataeibacter xylinus]|uniref:Uncharacterized protein n=1 Tax=Komagataeibacter xylinus TaxID=28448 RepID=A0A857FS66_KOMXY|nr:hypothetical protein [Komagataeibacter xylinus]QHC35987.1 hypothetical protein FMA36_11240 [Komagataeibacter xylinus]